jgi:hypothetical protein
MHTSEEVPFIARNGLCHITGIQSNLVSKLLSVSTEFEGQFFTINDGLTRLI